MNKVRSFSQLDQARDGRKDAGSSHVSWQSTGGKEKLKGFPMARQGPRFCDSHRKSPGLLSKSQLPLAVLAPSVLQTLSVFYCHHLSSGGVGISKHVRTGGEIFCFGMYSCILLGQAAFQKHCGMLKT